MCARPKPPPAPPASAQKRSPPAAYQPPTAPGPAAPRPAEAPPMLGRPGRGAQGPPRGARRARLCVLAGAAPGAGAVPRPSLLPAPAWLLRRAPRRRRLAALACCVISPAPPAQASTAVAPLGRRRGRPRAPRVCVCCPGAPPLGPLGRVGYIGLGYPGYWSPGEVQRQGRAGPRGYVYVWRPYPLGLASKSQRLGHFQRAADFTGRVRESSAQWIVLKGRPKKCVWLDLLGGFGTCGSAGGSGGGAFTAPRIACCVCSVTHPQGRWNAGFGIAIFQTVRR
jgi:hypothetical protein